MKAKDNDTKYQLRIDAGEIIDGFQKVYLQINTQAKNEASIVGRTERMRTSP